MINLLNKSVTLNQFSNIQTINTAVSDRNGFIDFNIVDDPAYNSIGKVEGHGICQSIKVPAITLDSFIETNAITKVDFIKIDIE
jgi:FkbM family methyltransferase